MRLDSISFHWRCPILQDWEKHDTIDEDFNLDQTLLSSNSAATENICILKNFIGIFFILNISLNSHGYQSYT